MHIHGQTLKKHLGERNGWDNTALDSIDWDMIGRVSNYNTHSEIIWRMKMTSGFVPFGTRMKLVKQWKSKL